MEKRKKKRKTGKILLLAMSFVLVIVLTFTITLAWFYDGDWASNYVTMAGSVGIRVQDNTEDPSSPSGFKQTSGAKQLHFNITTDRAYPGQAIDVAASVYNDGGRSDNNSAGTNGFNNNDTSGQQNRGSSAYIRARFHVFTDMGTESGSVELENESSKINATVLYNFLQTLITDINALPVADAQYYWQYFESTKGYALTDTGTSGTPKYYQNGTPSATSQTTGDGGYYYLCQKTGPGTTNSYLQELSVASAATFLWNGQFIIPWQLTNFSADKRIFIAIEFQAIQTFIPLISNEGLIDSKPDNQAFDAKDGNKNLIRYDNNSVQTVFNSCVFAPLSTTLEVQKLDNSGTEIIDFSGSGYSHISKPSV